MKKLNLLFTILLVASATFFTSCSKDTTTTPPTIMLNAGPGYTASDVSVPVNTVLKIGVIANSTSGKLTNLKIIQTISGIDTTLSNSTFAAKDALNEDFTITAAPVAGVVKLTFRITADDGEFAEASLTITTTSAPINTYTAVLMGGQENPNLGSFYSTIDNTVLKLAAARSNSQTVDLVYYYGTNLHASIVAVSDNQLQGVPSFVECAGWPVQNETKFKLTSGVDWSTITDESGILANATNLTETHINNLAVGDIISFVTAATSSNPSKNGMYKVMEINGTGGADRSITIEVKIQK